MTQADFENQIPRLGVLPVICGDVPLQEPFALWDTRTVSAYNPVQGTGPYTPPSWWASALELERTYYVGTLQNLGTGGAAFDLAIFFSSFHYGGVGAMTAQKLFNWGNSTEGLFGGGSVPTGWEDVDGEPCDGPFTYMIAFGDADGSPRTAFDPPVSNFNYTTFQCTLDSRTSSGQLDFQTFVDYQRDLFALPDILYPLPPDGPAYGGFGGMYTNEAYIEWYPDEPDADGNYYDFARKLVTITYEPRCAQAYLWIDEELIVSVDLNQTDSILYQSYGEHMLNGLCLDEGSPGDSFNRQFWYLGEHFCAEAQAFVGRPWNGIVGVALFRGTPSAADIAEWKAYFHPAGQVRHPDGFEWTQSHDGNMSQVGNIYTQTVPSGINKIRFSCRPAGGPNGRHPILFGNGNQNAYHWLTADINVPDNAVIEIHRGMSGRAGLYNAVSNPNPGEGGWPDGGEGGVNTAAPRADLFGGGGAGSTKLYVNGVLVVQLGGSGGGTYRYDLSDLGVWSAPVTRSGWSGGWIPNPPDVSGSYGYANNIPDPVFGGEPGSDVSAGNGGSGGGSAGSGNNGGVGADVSDTGLYVPSLNRTEYASGAGGGGGGWFGGGGGGQFPSVVTGQPEPCGGGPGSHYFNMAYVDQIIPHTADSTAALSPTGFDATFRVFHLYY